MSANNVNMNSDQSKRKGSDSLFNRTSTPVKTSKQPKLDFNSDFVSDNIAGIVGDTVEECMVTNVNDGLDVKAVIAEIIKCLVPTLTEIIKSTLQTELCKNKARSNILSYKLDELEQDNRRSTIRINVLRMW